MASPVAVVTGASRGLGAGIAEELARLGWHLGLCARTLPTHPPGDTPAVTSALDIRDAPALADFAEQVTNTLGPIGLWINNAGVLAPIGPLREAPLDDLDDHVAINLGGVIRGSRLFARIVHDRPEPGTLVNITSGAASSVYAGWAAYCATKAAVDQLSRVLAAEEADAGLSVYAVAPGVVDTDMQAVIRATPHERFPDVDRFIGLAETDSFNSPAWVARHLVELHTGQRSGDVVVRIPPEPRNA